MHITPLSNTIWNSLHHSSHHGHGVVLFLWCHLASICISLHVHYKLDCHSVFLDLRINKYIGYLILQISFVCIYIFFVLFYYSISSITMLPPLCNLQELSKQISKHSTTFSRKKDMITFFLQPYNMESQISYLPNKPSVQISI